MKSVLTKVKTLFSILIMIGFSFNASSDTSDELSVAPSDDKVWNTLEIFCSYLNQEVELIMDDYNDRRNANNDINKKIKDKTKTDEEKESFYVSEEADILIKEFEKNLEYRNRTIMPLLESRANIYNAFCKEG